MNYRSIIAALAAGIMLIGCNSQSSVPDGNALPPWLSLSSAHPSSRNETADSETVYVMNTGGYNATITVYSNGGSKLLRTIVLGEVNECRSEAYTLTANSLGLLYQEHPKSSDPCDAIGTLSIYKKKGSNLVGVGHLPKNYYALATDTSGNAYTMCGFKAACEFSPTGKKVWTINLRGDEKASSLAVDSTGHLAIVQQDTALVFQSDTSKPAWQISYSGGEFGPSAFDPSGNLYIVDYYNKGVLVYAPNASSPIRIIKNGVTLPVQITCDSAGNVYVLNGDSFSKYAPGQRNPEFTTKAGVRNGVSMAVSSKQHVFIANQNTYRSGNITEYSARSGILIRTITSSVQNPVAVGVSP